MRTCFACITTTLFLSGCAQKNDAVTSPDLQPQKVRGVWISADTFLDQTAMGTESLQQQMQLRGFNELFLFTGGVSGAGIFEGPANQVRVRAALAELQESTVRTALVWPLYYSDSETERPPELMLFENESFSDEQRIVLNRHRSWADEMHVAQEERQRLELLQFPTDRFVLSHGGEYQVSVGPFRSEWENFSAVIRNSETISPDSLYEWEPLTRQWLDTPGKDEWLNWRSENLFLQNAGILEQTMTLSRNRPVGISLGKLDQQYAEGAWNWSSSSNLINGETSSRFQESFITPDTIFLECMTPYVLPSDAAKEGFSEQASLLWRLQHASENIKSTSVVSGLDGTEDSDQQIIAIIPATYFAGEDLFLSEEEKQNLIQALLICEQDADGWVLLEWEFLLLNDFTLK